MAILDITLVAPNELRLVGDLDLSTAGAVREAFSRIDGPIRLDLAGVRFIDSTGIALLLERRRRTPVTLVHASGPVRQVMNLMLMHTTAEGLLQPGPSPL